MLLDNSGNPLICAGVDEWRNSKFTSNLKRALELDISMAHDMLEEDETLTSAIPHAKLRGIIAEARSIIMFIEMSTTEG